MKLENLNLVTNGNCVFVSQENYSGKMKKINHNEAIEILNGFEWFQQVKHGECVLIANKDDFTDCELTHIVDCEFKDKTFSKGSFVIEQ